MAFNNGGDERIAFGPMAKGQKKYGSTTSSRSKKNEQVVVYNVQRGDTLQGIAIKFGVNTEQIRRVNQLWTNDSLFLRDKLLIPVDTEQQSNDGDRDLDRNNSSFSSSSNLCSPILGDDANGGFKMQPHWTHPLCDSLEEDCIVVSPESVKLGSRSSNLDLNSSADTWCSNNSLFANSNVDGLSTASGGGMSNGTHSSSHSPLAYTKTEHTSMDNGMSSSGSYMNNSHHSDHQISSSTAPTSPSSASLSRQCSIVDHSEKSAEEFLSRIDSAIATSKKHAKNKEEQDKIAPWVTFDSDSESSDHRNSSAGTSISRQGRHLRYSLRKLEKAQEELFQL